MVQPAGDGVTLLYATIVLLVLAWVTFIARIGARIWKNNLGWDDSLMFIGLVIFSVTCSLCIACSFLGSGQKAGVLKTSDINQGTKLFWIAEFFYASGAATIKSSIAITLVRIADARRRFVWTIYGIVIATSISAIIFMITIANLCHPITILWSETTEGSCNSSLNSNISFFFSAIEILTDWALAILPAILLWNIQMKSRIKFTVGLILGLGAFASCATIVRLRYLSLYSNTSEFMFSTGKIGLWSIIEEGIGIFAGSLHALRPLLSLLPFRTLDSSAALTPEPLSMNKFKPKHKVVRSAFHLDTFRELEDGERDGDGSSQQHILKETHIAVTSDTRSESAASGIWERSQVLGWNQNNFESCAAEGGRTPTPR